MTLSNDIATFVIPAYIKNLEYLKFLEETINCLFKQTDDSWNAIIVEDFSPVGEVKELLHKYMNLDNRINCIFLDERKSTGMCRNEGIKWANVNNSSYIIYNDADDISHPDRVKVTRKIFKENPTASVVYSKFMVIDEKSKVTKRENVSKPIQYV
jgi:glycosyltransferase involved in cell wall biosynthesis